MPEPAVIPRMMLLVMFVIIEPPPEPLPETRMPVPPPFEPEPATPGVPILLALTVPCSVPVEPARLMLMTLPTMLVSVLLVMVYLRLEFAAFPTLTPALPLPLMVQPLTVTLTAEVSVVVEKKPSERLLLKVAFCTLAVIFDVPVP